jgi:hypothetical protein
MYVNKKKRKEKNPDNAAASTRRQRPKQGYRIPSIATDVDVGKIPMHHRSASRSRRPSFLQTRDERLRSVSYDDASS